MSKRIQYMGHEIHIYQPALSWKFEVEVDGKILRSAHRSRRVFTTERGALSAARRHVRLLERTPLASTVTCPRCGATLAHVAGGGVSACVCPVCDSEGLAELEENCPDCGALALDFRPESYVAHVPAGKYVIAVTYAGRPIADDLSRTHSATEYLPYYHPRAPAPGERRCVFLHRDKGPCKTLEQARARCVQHAAEQLKPTAPGADA